MVEYLVINHLYGNYYVTSGNPEDIEAICEQCFDSDRIVASFESDVEEGIVRAILPCCYEGAYLSAMGDSEEEAFKDWLKYAGYTEYDQYLQDDITDSFDAAKSIAQYLFEQKDINKYVYEELKNSIDVREQKWLDILTRFDFSSLENKVLEK